MTPAPASSSGSAVTGDIWRGKTMSYSSASNGTTPAQFGQFLFAAFNSQALPTSTNLFTSYNRLLATTAAPANSVSSRQGSIAAFWLGNAAGLGGFREECVWGVATTQTTLRVAIGLSATLPNLALEPSATLNCILMAADAGDANMQVMHNDGAGACTKIDLGASFPKTNNVVYLPVFTASANGTTVDYSVTRLDDATVPAATGTLSTNLPASTTFMAFDFCCGNGASAAIASIAFMRALTEQPQ